MKFPEIKLNSEYSAKVISREKVKVGCQMFKIEKLKEILKAAEEMPDGLESSSESYNRVYKKLLELADISEPERSCSEIHYGGQILLKIYIPPANTEWACEIFETIVNEHKINDRFGPVGKGYHPNDDGGGYIYCRDWSITNW
jgi:hypothetical protein